MSHKKRILFPVVVSADGAWDIAGWGFNDGPETDRELLDNIKMSSLFDDDYHPNPTIYWIEAWVPVPDDTTDPILGNVMQGQKE